MDDLGLDADRLGHQPDAALDAGELGARDVVRLAVRGVVAAHRDHERATSFTWTRCTNGNPSPGMRIGRPSSRRLKKSGSRVGSGVRGPSVCTTRSTVTGRSRRQQQVLALHLADAVRLARIRIIRRVASARLGDRLDEAAPIHGARAREDELLDAAGEQLEHRFEVGRQVSRVVEHDVELVAVRPERLEQRARLLCDRRGSAGTRRACRRRGC